MFFSAIWATGLAGYGGFPAVLIESCVFELAACLNGACSGSFLPFFGGETYALWREGCFSGLGGVCWVCSSRVGGFGLVGACVACVSRLGEGEGELEGTTYCTRTRAAWWPRLLTGENSLECAELVTLSTPAEDFEQ